MPVDIAKITAALNAYPWTRGTFSIWFGDHAKYCAVGQLLRYAGVPQAEIECAGPAPVVWRRYRELIESEYGITGRAMTDIIHANDSAMSHEDAIERVQFVLQGGNLAKRFAAQQQAVVDSLAAAAVEGLEDDGGACGALVG